jgi:endoglucanase Acf2
MKFPGLLPVLPNALGEDQPTVRGLLDSIAAQKPQTASDTYWDGKNLGRLATLLQLARETGADTPRQSFQKELRARLENWLSADDFSGQPKNRLLFYYDKNWGTLIGNQASYGSDVELNDHHFHYGYFLQGAAALALEDPQWPKLWSNMVELVIRDFASPDRSDPMFPFLRCIDPYAGHSWASGAARFADGNNQESSSEAMNAWAGLFWWGEITGNPKWRDLGAWLFTTELAGVEHYWFDVTGTLRPTEYKPAVVTMVWGGKEVHETWFSAKPEDKHMINWLPFTGASLYLGRHPAYVHRNYEALRTATGTDNWASAADLILMYRALDDAGDALRQYRARPALRTDSGNSQANVFYWISNLNQLGQVDASVTADRPTTMVFNQAGRKTHVFFNPRGQPETATFSDGARVAAAPGKFGLSRVKP